jgi:hypothetical protein
VAGCFEHGNEPSGFVNGGKLPYQLIDCQLLKNDILMVTHGIGGMRNSCSMVLF